MEPKKKKEWVPIFIINKLLKIDIPLIYKYDYMILTFLNISTIPIYQINNTDY